MREEHVFRKSETELFLAQGLDRPNQLEATGKFGRSAQAVIAASQAREAPLAAHRLPVVRLSRPARSA